MDEYKYEAFISYRHLNPDEIIAKKLHFSLETYKIPHSIRKQINKIKMGRVFRDEDELPLDVDLSHNIEQALKESKWLIVICTPELLKSKWCMKEIDTFISLGRRDHILAVLAEGTPEESFPSQLRFIEKNGQTEEVEPLAANVIAGSVPAMLKKLRTEKLRILAPILGVNYDDLRRRTRRRKLKAFISISLGILVLIGSFITYAIIQGEKIREQKVIAEQKRKESINSQMITLQEKSRSAASQGDKLGGLAYALSANDLGTEIDTKNDDELISALESSAYIGSFECISVIKNNKLDISNLVYSPDKKLILGSAKDDSAVVIDAFTGEILYSVNGNKGHLYSTMFSADSKYFLTGYYWDNSVSVWDSTNGKLVAEYNLESTADTIHYSNELGYAAFLPDSEQLMINEENRVVVWNFLNGEKKNFDVESEMYEDAALSPDGSLAAVGDRPALLSLRDGSVRYPDASLKCQYSKFCFSADGKYLAAANGHLLAIWDVATGDELLSKIIVEVDHSINSIKFCPNSNLIGLGSDTGFVLYDFFAKQTILSDPNPDNNIYTIEFDPSGKYLLVNSEKARMQYDLRTLKQIEELKDLQVYNASFCESDEVMQLVIPDKGICVYSLPSISMVKSESAFKGDLCTANRWDMNKISGPVNSYHSSPPVGGGSVFYERGYTDPNGRYFAQAYTDGIIEVWDPAASKDPVYTIQEHNGKVVTDLVFHDGLIASSDFYGKVVIFNLSTGNILYVFETGGKVTNIEFSPDGTKLIVLNADQNTAQVFSVKSGILLFSMRGNDHEISKVGFTADGNKAVALFTDGGDVYCNVFNDLDSLVKHARSILGK